MTYTLFHPMLLWPEKEGDPPSGFNYELWKVLEESVNATSELVPSPSFGKILDNGSWTGMVGLMQTNQVDLSLCPLHTFYERYLAATYIVAVSSCGKQFV